MKIKRTVIDVGPLIWFEILKIFSDTAFILLSGVRFLSRTL